MNPVPTSAETEEASENPAVAPTQRRRCGKQDPTRRQFHVLIGGSDAEDLTALAESYNCSVSLLIRVAIGRYLKQMGRK